MKIDKASNGEYLIALSRSELITINNCMNEVCHGIDVQEFQTRIGESRERVREMLDTVSLSLDHT